MALAHAWSVEPCCFARRCRVTPPPAALGQPALTPVAATRPPRPPSRGMPCPPPLAEGRPCGCELPQERRAMGALPCLCLGGGAHESAPPPFPVAAADFLDPPLVRAALSAARALSDLAWHRIAATQGPTQEGVPPTGAARGERRLRPQPRIAHTHAAAQGPPPELGVALGHRGDSDRRARQAPVPHRHALARPRYPPRPWGGITPAGLRESAFARRLRRLGPCREAAVAALFLAAPPVDRRDRTRPGGGSGDHQGPIAAAQGGQSGRAHAPPGGRQAHPSRGSEEAGPGARSRPGAPRHAAPVRHTRAWPWAHRPGGPPWQSAPVRPHSRLYGRRAGAR